jgi:hypothetical protein
MKLTFLLPALTVFGMTVSAHAVLVADYQFVGNSTANGASSDIATATNISFPHGSITAAQFLINNSGNQIPESLSASLSGSNYLSFTVTPSEDSLAFSSITFNFGLTNNTSSVNPYTGNWAVFSSVDGFSDGSQIQTGSFSLASGSGSAGFFADPAPNVSLSGVSGLQNVSSPTEFRIYYWDNASVSTSNLNLRIDAIQLNATAVPEPQSLALCALGLGAVLWRTRKARA